LPPPHGGLLSSLFGPHHPPLPHYPLYGSSPIISVYNDSYYPYPSDYNDYDYNNYDYSYFY
jgi:hypothetical protein